MSDSAPLLRKIKTLLKNHYTAPLQVAFQQFRLGLGVFFLGLVMIYMGQKVLTPSLQQELLTLTGLVAMSVGFLMAMTAHIRMLIIRLVNFFRRKN